MENSFENGMSARVPVDSAGLCAVLAIPANNEADRIEACLAALSVQRDATGAPIAAGRFRTLVFANNCNDGTAACVRAVAARSPHPIELVEATLGSKHANAGWARKHAMDLAADRLRDGGCPDGFILTSDADSLVAPTWFDATMRAFATGVDCVAGYIDAHPLEIMRLGRAFVARGRLEDRYLRAVAEIYALCDPRPHDPWPNHRVSSGASLAVTRAAYLSIGGLPPKPVGEDAALSEALENAGFKIRHSLDVMVSTSCRFDGRAQGGAADTMRHRHAAPEAPCDDDLEPALPLARRALYKGTLRRLFESGRLDMASWSRRLGLADRAPSLPPAPIANFEALWSWIMAESPVLRLRTSLRPSDLPHEIERAALVIRTLRARRPDRATLGPAILRAAEHATESYAA